MILEEGALPIFFPVHFFVLFICPTDLYNLSKIGSAGPPLVSMASASDESLRYLRHHGLEFYLRDFVVHLAQNIVAAKKTAEPSSTPSNSGSGGGPNVGSGAAGSATMGSIGSSSSGQGTSGGLQGLRTNVSAPPPAPNMVPPFRTAEELRQELYLYLQSVTSGSVVMGAPLRFILATNRNRVSAAAQITKVIAIGGRSFVTVNEIALPELGAVPNDPSGGGTKGATSCTLSASSALFYLNATSTGVQQQHVRDFIYHLTLLVCPDFPFELLQSISQAAALTRTVLVNHRVAFFRSLTVLLAWKEFFEDIETYYRSTTVRLSTNFLVEESAALARNYTKYGLENTGWRRASKQQSDIPGMMMKKESNSSSSSPSIDALEVDPYPPSELVLQALTSNKANGEKCIDQQPVSADSGELNDSAANLKWTFDLFVHALVCSEDVWLYLTTDHQTVLANFYSAMSEL